MYRTTRLRLKGYGDALKRFGLGWETLRFYESDSNDPAGGAATAAEIFVADSRPTAILTDSDQLALGVIQAAVSAGIQVPEDLSIVGSDDIPAASVVTPALTTIKQPLISKGEEAGRILLGKSSAENKLILPFELVIRSSTAPARARRRRKTSDSVRPASELKTTP